MAYTELPLCQTESIKHVLAYSVVQILSAPLNNASGGTQCVYAASL